MSDALEQRKSPGEVFTTVNEPPEHETLEATVVVLVDVLAALAYGDEQPPNPDLPPRGSEAMKLYLALIASRLISEQIEKLRP